MGQLYQFNKNTNELMKVTSGGGSGSVLPYATYMANLPGSETELELLKTQLSDGCIIITNEANEEEDSTPVVLLEKKAVAYIDSIPQDPAEFREFASTLQDGAIIVTNEDAPLSSRFMGEMVWSILPIDDSGAHLLDGATLTYSKYPVFYGYIKKLYDSGECPNLFAEASAYEQSLTDYGVCGKFVIDTVNMTVRLPKITGIVEGTIDKNALGDLVEAGLPNITGNTGSESSRMGDVPSSQSTGFNTGSFSGAFGIGVKNGGYQIDAIGQSSRATLNELAFDASKSNSIYGNSATVQPQTVKGFLYIIVGATVGNITDVDIAGLAAHAAMPSSKYIDLELPASGSTTIMPADGYVEVLSKTTAAGGVLGLNEIIGNENRTLFQGDRMGSGGYVGASVAVRKGSIISIYYTNANIERFRLYYCNGSAPAE